MRSKLSDDLEKGRVLEGHYASSPGEILGAFSIRGPCGVRLAIISSGSDSETIWEHVSVSTGYRTPNWEEMVFVKNLFWDDEECVIQLHPPKSEYVNVHPFCLHLWKSLGEPMPMPPSMLVGPK